MCAFSTRLSGRCQLEVGWPNATGCRLLPVDSAPTYSGVGGSAGVPGASVLPRQPSIGCLPHALVTAADLPYSLVTRKANPPAPRPECFLFSPDFYGIHYFICSLDKFVIFKSLPKPLIIWIQTRLNIHYMGKNEQYAVLPACLYTHSDGRCVSVY